MTETLYTMAGTCALAPNIAAAWTNAPIEVKNLARGDQRKEPYLSINPKGQVPALVFDDGDVLTEAVAILRYIGDAHGKADFSEKTPHGRKEVEALSYMTSEVHATFGGHFATASFAESKSAQEEVKAATYDKLRKHYQRLEDNLKAAGGEWYIGKKSFADAYLYVILRWIELTPINIGDYPTLHAFRRQMEKDEHVLKALKRQDMKPVDE